MKTRSARRRIFVLTEAAHAGAVPLTRSWCEVTKWIRAHGFQKGRYLADDARWIQSGYAPTHPGFVRDLLCATGANVVSEAPEAALDSLECLRPNRGMFGNFSGGCVLNGAIWRILAPAHSVGANFSCLGLSFRIRGIVGCGGRI